MESHSLHTNRHIQVIQYGTGIFDWKTVRVVYLDGNEVIAKKPFALLRRVGRFNNYVSWAELERSQTESVRITSVYSISFFGEAESREMEFNYRLLETEIRTSPYYP